MAIASADGQIWILHLLAQTQRRIEAGRKHHIARREFPGDIFEHLETLRLERFAHLVSIGVLDHIHDNLFRFM